LPIVARSDRIAAFATPDFMGILPDSLADSTRAETFD